MSRSAHSGLLDHPESSGGSRSPGSGKPSCDGPLLLASRACRPAAAAAITPALASSSAKRSTRAASQSLVMCRHMSCHVTPSACAAALSTSYLLAALDQLLEGCSPSSSFLCSPVAPLGAVITWLKSVQRAVLLVGLAQNHGGPPCGHSKQAHPVGLSLCRMSCTVAANFSVLQSQHTYMQKAGALSSFMVTKAEQLTSGILAIAVMGPQVRPCCVRARTAARWRHANAR